MMFRIEHNIAGPRVYVLGKRVHHGVTGIALFCVGVRVHRTSLTCVGISLLVHDRKDWPFRDCDNH